MRWICAPLWESVFSRPVPPRSPNSRWCPRSRRCGFFPPSYPRNRPRSHLRRRTRSCLSQWCLQWLAHRTCRRRSPPRGCVVPVKLAGGDRRAAHAGPANRAAREAASGSEHTSTAQHEATSTTNHEAISSGVPASSTTAPSVTVLPAIPIAQRTATAITAPKDRPTVLPPISTPSAAPVVPAPWSVRTSGPAAAPIQWEPYPAFERVCSAGCNPVWRTFPQDGTGAVRGWLNGGFVYNTSNPDSKFNGPYNSIDRSPSRCSIRPTVIVDESLRRLGGAGASAGASIAVRLRLLPRPVAQGCKIDRDGDSGGTTSTTASRSRRRTSKPATT